MIYEIRVIDHYQGTGGDDNWDAERTTKQAAFNYAKRRSLKPDAYEVMILEYAGKRGMLDYVGDFTHQWYFQNGEMTCDMGGNN